MIGHVTEPDEALTEADQALALDSGSSEVLGFAGCALSDLGHTTRGIELLEKAIEQDPSNAQAWVALGAALLTNRQPELAIAKLEHGLRISPRDNRLAVWAESMRSPSASSGVSTRPSSRPASPAAAMTSCTIRVSSSRLCW